MNYSTAAVITNVSTLLADQREGAEFTTWSEGFLRACLVEALTALRPIDSLIALDSAVLPLKAGHYQQLPENIREDVQVLHAFVDGEMHSDITRVEYKSLANDAGLAPKVSLKRGLFADDDRRLAWSLQRWAWDGKVNPAALLVYPPVPSDGKVRSLVVAYLRDTATVGAHFTLSSAYYRAVIAFMLYRAYSVSSDSPNHAKLAENFLNEFNSITGGGKPK